MKKRLKKQKDKRLNTHAIKKMSYDEQIHYLVLNKLLRFEDKYGKLKSQKLYVMSEDYRYANITHKSEDYKEKIEFPVYFLLEEKLNVIDGLCEEISDTNEYYIYFEESKLPILENDRESKFKRYLVSFEQLKVYIEIKKLKIALNKFYQFSDEDCIVEEGVFVLGCEKMDNLFEILKEFSSLINDSKKVEIDLHKELLVNSQNNISDIFINSIFEILNGKEFDETLENKFFKELVELVK